MELDELLVAEHAIGAQHGVHVHAERLGEIARGRQSLAADDAPVDDGGPDGGGELLEQRRRTGRVEADEHILILLF